MECAPHPVGTKAAATAHSTVPLHPMLAAGQVFCPEASCVAHCKPLDQPLEERSTPHGTHTFWYRSRLLARSVRLNLSAFSPFCATPVLACENCFALVAARELLEPLQPAPSSPPLGSPAGLPSSTYFPSSFCTIRCLRCGYLSSFCPLSSLTCMRRFHNVVDRTINGVRSFLELQAIWPMPPPVLVSAQAQRQRK